MFHPAGTPVQPPHEHAILVDELQEACGGRQIIWLPTEKARMLADYCGGCAWQVKVDDHVTRRLARLG